MLSLPLPRSVRRVFFVGVHCDDVAIGCGGTLPALARSHSDVELSIAVFTSEEGRARHSEKALTRSAAVAILLEAHGISSDAASGGFQL